MPWLLYKRYRDFDLLHQNVHKFIAANVHLKNVVLPTLPPKRLVRSLAPEVVEKRRRELQQYLRKLLESDRLLKNSLLLDFLSVPESLRAMLMRSDHLHSKGRSLHRLSESQRDDIANDEREINELLRELALQKNRYSIR